jgi:hypothetical protein
MGLLSQPVCPIGGAKFCITDMAAYVTATRLVRGCTTATKFPFRCDSAGLGPPLRGMDSNHPSTLAEAHRWRNELRLASKICLSSVLENYERYSSRIKQQAAFFSIGIFFDRSEGSARPSVSNPSRADTRRRRLSRRRCQPLLEIRAKPLRRCACFACRAAFHAHTFLIQDDQHVMYGTTAYV